MGEILLIFESIENIISSVKSFFNAVNIFNLPSHINVAVVIVLILLIWWGFKWLVKQILLLPFKFVSRSIKTGIKRNKNKKVHKEQQGQASNYDW